MFAFERFKASDGTTYDWDGPANGNLSDEGFPQDVREAIEGGLTVTDTLNGEVYEMRDGQLVVTMPGDDQ